MFGTAPKSRLERLADKLGRLKKRDPNQRIFGADEHRWATRPPLTTTEIESFERRHGVALPAEYREFVQSIGAGGAGPGYGLLSIDDFGVDLEPIPEGFLAAEFSQTETWEPEHVMEDISEAAYVREVQGTIRLSHGGCGYYDFLVVSGPARGEVWHDARVSDGGLRRPQNPDGSGQSFFDWYESWLDQSLAKT